MKSRTQILVLISAISFAFCAIAGAASSTIDPINKYAYGANIGWMDWRGDTNNGARIGEYICSGYVYAANVGWISLGGGSPTNGIYYQNLSATDFGVNQDGLGNLRGFAYGANIGWVNFENTGAPRVDLTSGRLTGYAYSANCGWINLSNVFAYVQTDTIAPGAVGTNGLPIAWQLLNFGNTNVDASADADGDGLSNMQEYLAGSNPNDPNDKLAVTAFSATPGGTLASLGWSSTPTRFYYIEETLSLTSPSSLWVDSGLGLIVPDGSSTSRTITFTNAPNRFYRVRAVMPLAP